MAIESKTPSEQIAILKSRNLIIPDASFARKVLERKNYYNIINAFKDLFLDTSYVKKNDNDPIERYKNGTTFNEVYNVYLFDVNLRNIFLKYILMIENELRTVISANLSDAYNSSAYFSDVCYSGSSKKIKEVQDSILDTYKKNKNNPMISHFIDRGDMVPIWALSNTFELGLTRRFLDCLNDKLKNKISNFYSITFSQLISFVSLLNMFRNVCAHNNRTYCYQINDEDKQISDTNVHANMNIIKAMDSNNNPYYTKGKRDLFACVICFKYLLSDDDFINFYNELKSNIDNLSKALQVISIEDVINKMGFPIEDINKGQLSWIDIISVSK